MILPTVLPAKSESDVMFWFIRDLTSIDHLCINPIHRYFVKALVIQFMNIIINY